MASKTTNLNLHKIDLTDAPPDITVINGNWDIIDAELSSKPNMSDVESYVNTQIGNAIGGSY